MAEIPREVGEVATAPARTTPDDGGPRTTRRLRCAQAVLVGGQRNGKADLMHAALATATPPSLPPSQPKGPPRALVPPSLYLLVTRFGDTVFNVTFDAGAS